MQTTDYLLAKFLGCDVSDTKKLNSIVLDVDEYFDKVVSKTPDGIGKAVYEDALGYLVHMYRFASQQLQDVPNLYDGTDLGWDSDLLHDALNYLAPEKDLHYGFTSTEFYMELDNWDLYASVIATINDDYNSGYSFKVLISEYTTEFYGGEKTPDKYDSLLL